MVGGLTGLALSAVAVCAFAIAAKSPRLPANDVEGANHHVLSQGPQESHEPEAAGSTHHGTSDEERP